MAESGTWPGQSAGEKSVTRSSEGPSQEPASRREAVKQEWNKRLQPGEQAVVLAWSSFTATFVCVRALTHWIRGGHGPSGGGMSLAGRHFHHYNIGIGLLATIGAVALRGEERHSRHPATAVAYGSALALIVDELALLMDLEDVYWARDGRKSVDAAVTLVAAGGTFVAGMPFWPHARHQLRR